MKKEKKKKKTSAREYRTTVAAIRRFVTYLRRSVVTIVLVFPFAVEDVCVCGGIANQAGPWAVKRYRLIRSTCVVRGPVVRPFPSPFRSRVLTLVLSFTEAGHKRKIHRHSACSSYTRARPTYPRNKPIVRIRVPAAARLSLSLFLSS